jgi:hypothetical protein
MNFFRLLFNEYLTPPPEDDSYSRRVCALVLLTFVAVSWIPFWIWWRLF